MFFFCVIVSMYVPRYFTLFRLKYDRGQRLGEKQADTLGLKYRMYGALSVLDRVIR